MLFRTKLVVLGKAMYQNAFLAFENRLNVDLLLSCLGLLLFSSKYTRKEVQIQRAISLL